MGHIGSILLVLHDIMNPALKTNVICDADRQCVQNEGNPRKMLTPDGKYMAKPREMGFCGRGDAIVLFDLWPLKSACAGHLQD